MVKESDKLMKWFKKILQTDKSKEKTEHKLKIDTNRAILNRDNTIGLIPKTPRIKKMLEQFLDNSNYNEIKIDYNNTGVQKTKIDYERIKNVMDLLKIFKQNITFTVKTNIPITIENEEIKVIIAPLVHNW